MEKREGFEHQRLMVVPRPMVVEALSQPITRRMVVTDAGYFPRATDHARRRAQGVPETIVIVCVSGRGWVESEGRRSGVGAATAIVIPPHVPHAYGASEDDPWTIWWCHMRGSDIPDFLGELGAGPRRLTFPLRAVDRVTAHLDEIAVAIERRLTPASLVATAGIAWRMWSQLAVDRVVSEDGTPVERALRYLAERIDGRVTVPELAALVGISPSHLSTLVREVTGGGVLAYHRSLKMARARELLDTTELPVGEIAKAVGMEDPFYFSRQFRQVHGLSPSQYRATRKG
ncbi:AraC family transcriptional regulator [Demequina muriae]|uniref:AraC family transcriptional regulator n=1 Tax=Demequina muriae TaxID=3051664 RepID=A0ABT8GI07_9MICO|nr:AraC family transcriptional regulator [Demequina sp. EGI L300058]MDN4481064.1 AraC family transcriptional regulator [Demequina sp. EGI L300058]